MTNKATEVLDVADLPIYDQYVVVSPSGTLFGGYDTVFEAKDRAGRLIGGGAVYAVTFREVYTTDEQFFPQTEAALDYSNERG